PMLLKSFDDVFQFQTTPEDHHEAAAPFSVSQVLKGAPFHGKEVLLRKQNKEESYFLLSASHLLSEENIIGCVVVLTDTTGLKQLEMELEAERERLAVTLERYRDLFNSMSDLIMTHDMEGHLLTINPAVCKTLGYTSEEMIGRPISDFIIPKFRRLFRDEYLEQIRHQGLSEGVVLFQAKDGIKHYVEYRNVLVKKQGSEPYVSCSGRDITERVYAERTLRKSEEKFRKISASAQDAIVIIAPS
ncbi:MAG: PAS domain S-box protein, partial [Pseudomonadota bacterium]